MAEARPDESADAEALVLPFPPAGTSQNHPARPKPAYRERVVRGSRKNELQMSLF